MNSLFITGSTGFIGSNLVRKIDPARFQNIYCLNRTDTATPSSERFRFIKGTLADVESYAPHLALCDTVIHMAAATGKATPEEYLSVNTAGTEALIEQCKRSGVENFLYVSTISVKFQNKERYYYAQSKEAAEQAVRKSGLNYVVVRPTIVIGREAVIWKTLSGLAKRRVILMPGDGTTRIQPIYVDDLVDYLLTILYEDLFENQTIEVGGPETISFERLLKRIHYFYYGKEPSVVHIPLKPLVAMLSLIEERYYSMLPISVGQLAAFSNDGTIETNGFFGAAGLQMEGVDSMLKRVIANE